MCCVFHSLTEKKHYTPGFLQCLNQKKIKFITVQTTRFFHKNRLTNNKQRRQNTLYKKQATSNPIYTHSIYFLQNYIFLYTLIDIYIQKISNESSGGLIKIGFFSYSCKWKPKILKMKTGIIITDLIRANKQKN